MTDIIIGLCIGAKITVVSADVNDIDRYNDASAITPIHRSIPPILDRYQFFRAKKRRGLLVGNHPRVSFNN